MSIDGVGRGGVRQVTPRAVEGQSGPVAKNALARPLAAKDVFEAKSAQSSSSGNANLPPIQSNTGTVQAGTVQLDDATKVARGALKIDSNADPKTYDGMYLGSDGYAYPPDKFSVSEVPPFKPEKPIASPTPTTYHVNGILTQPQGDGNATGEAQKLANETGTNVVPIYNATEGLPADVTQTGLDRLGLGDNKAAQTLADAIYRDLQAGKKVNVTGYSQGGAIVSSALRDVDNRIKDDMGGFWGNLPVFGDGNRDKREALLGNINVSTFAGAGKTFPDGPKYTFYVNKQDPVPTWLGTHAFNPVTDIVSGIASGLFPGIGILNGGPSTQYPEGATIHTFDSAGNGEVFALDGKHGIDTYLNNIQDAV
ncbi:PE-PPE domain-containing protein [Corallococcus exiguus]|uniref:PE-PPE domain-containing protein n=1 Tax=Corallococcus TaxID=83461 RepID=UPI000F860184|nr:MULTISPECIES: PE-PPE domain-containing protein [Corallococcus]NRD65451.1 PE-PPE domain-containing protein [Corallococcus exiguus]RUO91012.1 PE-PPE domain-containing protein [Corallococcus sp. AB018]